MKVFTLFLDRYCQVASKKLSFLAIKKNETMPFAATWVVIEIVTLGEVNQAKTNATCYHLHVESKIRVQVNWFTNQNQVTDVKTNLMVTWKGRDKLGDWNGHVYTAMHWASLTAQLIKNLPAVQETQIRFLGQKDPLEEEMATHSSILAWRIPWAEEPERLQSMGSQESDMT